MAADDYNYDGIHDIKKIEIESHNGETFNVAEALASLSIYEDMFATNITASLTLMDTTNSLMHMSILGYEKVKIEFDLPGTGKPLKYNFVISAVSDKQKAGDGKQLYTMELISEDAFKNVQTMVSKSFVNKKYHEMVSELHGMVSSRPLSTEPSEGIFTLPLSYTKPVKGINLISTYAKSQAFQQPSYLYFEREDGYWWKTIDIMMTSGPSATYDMMPKDNRPPMSQEYGSTSDSSSVKQVKGEALTPDNLHWDKYFDLLDGMTSGMYDSELLHIDFENKKFSTIPFSYKEEFDKRDGDSLHVKKTKGAYLPQGKPDLVSKVTNSKNRVVMAPVTNKASGDYDRPNITKDRIVRDGRLKEIDVVKLNMEVPGTLWVRTGDIVELKLWSEQGYDPEKDGLAVKEKYHTGNFIVTASAHHLTLTKFKTVMELATDNLDMKFDEQVYTVSRKVNKRD